MNKRTVLLFFLLILLFSCKESSHFKFERTDFSDTSLFTRFILPLHSRELLKDLPYSNLYRLYIDIDRQSKTVSAEAHILYYNSSGLDLQAIQFRMLMNRKDHTPMIIHSVQIDEIPFGFSLSEDKTTLAIALGKELLPGKTANLTIHYSLDFTTRPSYYFDFARIDENGFSIPHFFPIAARIVKGEWENDPLADGGDLLSADSSWFMVEIVTDDKVVIVTSGKEISSEIRRGRQKKAYVAGPVRDFFICGATSYIPQVTLSGETNIISYSLNKDIASSRKAASITASALSLFSSKFGIYPYEDLKITALPMSALGIEFPSVFSIKEDLYKDPDGYLFEPTIVHETAHQWFYSLLGNNQLRDPWIDEGLAQYSVWLYYRERYGASTALRLFNSFTDRWDRIERQKLPINKNVGFYQGKEYGAIIYGRAPIFLLDVKNIMGEELFHRFIRHLITQYSHKQIDTEIFRTELIHFAGASIDPLFGEYFD